MSLNKSNKGSNDEKEQEDLLIAEQEQDLPVEIEEKKKEGNPTIWIYHRHMRSCRH